MNTVNKIPFVVAGIAILLIIGLTIALTPTNDEVIRKMEKAGFTEVKLLENRYFSCGEHDLVMKGFTAKSNQNQVVEGTVCCDLRGCYFKY